MQDPSRCIAGSPLNCTIRLIRRITLLGSPLVRVAQEPACPFASCRRRTSVSNSCVRVRCCPCSISSALTLNERALISISAILRRCRVRQCCSTNGAVSVEISTREATYIVTIV